MRRLTLLLALFVLPVVFIGYAVWSVLQTRSDLEHARRASDDLTAALRAGQAHQASASLAVIQGSVGSAADRTSGPTWWVLSHVPGVGDDFDAVRTVSSALDGLASSGLPPMLDVADSLQGAAFTPKNGRINLAALSSLSDPIAQASASFDRAVTDLAPVKDASLSSLLQDQVGGLVDDVDLGARMLHAASTAVDVAPRMLGADHPQHWLVVFQNNAEVRATGGLPGAAAVVVADHGRLTMGANVAGRSFLELAKPVLPLTPDERKLYGPFLGTWFLDANFTPDFPRAADLWRARWEAESGQRLDGVLAVDPVALSYVLKATGPVSVMGGQLSVANAVSVLLHDVYVNIADPDQQDAYFAAVTSGVFNHVTTGAGSPADLVVELARASEEHRLLIHSFDPALQAPLDGSEVAGEAFADRGQHPTVLVTLNDATGAKMQYYLRYDVHVTASCQDGHQAYEASMDLSSTAPKDAKKSLPFGVTGGGFYGIPAGTQVMNVRIYGPVGGSVGRLLLDGKKFQYEKFSEHGHPVAMTPVFLDPGQTTTLSWPMTAAEAQPESTYVDVTPGVMPEDESSVVAAAC